MKLKTVHRLFIHRKGIKMTKICPVILNCISQLGNGVQLPNQYRNHCVFDENRTNEILKQAEHALPVVDTFLKSAVTEEQVLDGLHVIDKMADLKVKNLDKIYPTLSRFNYCLSPNIQVMLAGIYRKTLIPDAFGPLNRMLQQQIYYPNSPYFDPTEEIGGAILEYNRSFKI